MRLRIALVVMLLLSAIPVLAQFGETIEVRVINVDVIVTDKSGKPIPGLTKDDFVVIENGKPRDVTNFYEYQGANAPGVAQTALNAPATPSQALPASADIRSRKIVLFVDGSTLRPFSRNRVLKATKEFLHKIVRPGDEILIANWDHRLEVSDGFLHDVATAETKLDQLAKASSVGAARDAELSEMQSMISWTANEARDTTSPGPGGEQVITVTKVPIDEVLSRARLYAMRKLHEQNAKVESLRSVIGSVRGVEGRKVLVFVTESLTETPGREVFDLIDSIKYRFEGGNSYVVENEIQQYADRLLIPTIAKEANSAGVTLYPIDAGGLSAGFDDIGADRLSVQYTAPTRRSDTIDERGVALRSIADLTGGIALTASNNFTLAFDNIASDLTSYYSLGYRASGEKQDMVRSIHVKLKQRHNGYHVRTRNAFVEKSITSEMADAVAANLFYPVTKNDLQITVTAGEKSSAEASKILVPVEVTIPTSSLTFVPEGNEMLGGFSTFTAFVRSDGVVSDVQRQRHQLRFNAATLPNRREITLKLAVTMENNSSGVSLGVMDDVSHATGFAAVKFPGE
ncbi:MAG TPA: VWA domain-containing protein [Thermoanaerobaculia bacterium]|nr:VWA domain-containing protein [Thermoanaerobaculia bacterium]